MHQILSPSGVTVSFDQYGSGPPLLLVHGSFSNHQSNWEYVKPYWEQQFTTYAIARRGRGETDATENHSLIDESQDVKTLIMAIDEPVFLLGHSYGAHVALAAATEIPDRIRKLVLYEPLWPHIIEQTTLTQLDNLAQGDRWDDLVTTFFHEALSIPLEELEALQPTEFWPPLIADANASLGDVRALAQYNFDADHFRELRIPVMLQVGTESPRNLYITDALAAVLANVHIEELPDQAHEAMTTAPQMYAEAVSCFLLG